MSVSLAIHRVTDLRAEVYPEIPSFRIHVFTEDGQTGPHDVVLFSQDVVLIERIADAINRIARERAEEKSIAEEEVAS